MKGLFLILCLLSFSSIAGLPPASSKANGESNYFTTFKTNYGTWPVTRVGTLLNLGTLPVTMGGTGLSTVGTETKVLKVVSGFPAYGEEDRSNLLVNPNFEDTSLTGWTCGLGGTIATGSCFSTSAVGNVTEGLSAYAIQTGTTPTIISASQSVATLSGSTTQYVVGVSYKVDSTMTDFQICTLIAGVEKTCVPSANLIIDNAYHSIEIPEVITPGSTVGIKVKTTATYAGKIAYLDKAYIKAGIGTQALQLDNVYSAQVSATGVISGENIVGWISSTSIASTSNFTLNTSVSTVQMNCNAVINGALVGTADKGISILSQTATSVVVQTVNNGVGAAAYPFTITCQKSGKDYLASSAAVYSQASANPVSVYAGGTPAAYGINSPVIFPTSFFDTTNGGYSTSTGRFTVPSGGDGYYQINAYVGSNNFPFTIYASKNASLVLGAGATNLCSTIASMVGCGGSGILKAAAGDVIDIRQTTSSGTPVSGSFSIAKIQGNGLLIGSFAGYSPITSQVGARAYASATVISGTLATVVWTTESYDANSALASGVFTCPVAGKYQVNTRVEVAGTIALNTQLDLQVQKNGTAFAEDLKYAGGVMTDQTAQLSDVINCVVGDTIMVQVSSGATTPSIVPSNSKNFFSIQWVGP